MKQPVVAAYGAGVDSTAMLIELVESGERVDVALYAMTKAEKPWTDRYAWLFAQWLADRGVEFHAVQYKPKRFKHHAPYQSLDENCFTNNALPSISFGQHTCSQKWKITPQDHWVAQWQPAVDWWAAGGRVRKLIGYDAGGRDTRRYAHAVGKEDPLYENDYPLQRLGWARDRCEQRIAAAGLPIPAKSACYMCGAMQPWEVRLLPVHQLRRIVLMEALAKPNLRNIEGLWRRAVKGMRGAVPRPGDMTTFIVQEELLSDEEVEWITIYGVRAILAFKERAAAVPLEERAGLAKFLDAFDAQASNLSLISAHREAA